MPTDFGINRESLTRELLARGLTQNEFCRRTGITTNTLARINKGLPVRGDTIGKIARGLAAFPKIDGVEGLLGPQEASS